MPDFADKFILDYFLTCIRGWNAIGFDSMLNFFGFETKRLVNLIEMIWFFCKWLFIHKFSKTKVKVSHS